MDLDESMSDDEILKAAKDCLDGSRPAALIHDADIVEGAILGNLKDGTSVAIHFERI